MFGWGDEEADPLGLLYLEPGAIADRHAVALHDAANRSPQKSRSNGLLGADDALGLGAVLCAETTDFLDVDSVELLSCHA